MPRVQLQISGSLRKRLVAIRTEQLQKPHADDVLTAHEVVILSPGFGPALYLRLDGWIVIWNYMDDEAPVITEDIRSIAAALVIGAKNLSLPELLGLLPSRPDAATDCQKCAGKRWYQFGTEGGTNKPGFIVCPWCHGLGWQTDMIGP